MTLAYQLSYECGEYTHGDVLVTSTDYDDVVEKFHHFLGVCLMDDAIGNNSVDYVCIETIDVEFDDDGFPCTDDDNPVVALEYIFNDQV